jgi:IS5 family transposase
LTGYEPESVHVDRIYRTLLEPSGPVEKEVLESADHLEEDPPQMSLKKKRSRLEKMRKFGVQWRETLESRNEDERLERVMTKLANTSQTAIGQTFLVMNLSTWLRQVFCVVFCPEAKTTPVDGFVITKSYNLVNLRPAQLMFQPA